MHTFRRVLGVDVGTRGTRVALISCPNNVIYMGKIGSSRDLLLWAQQVDGIAIAGGYSWKLLEDHEILNNIDKISLKREPESETGFREILKMWPLVKKVVVLPSAASSPYISPHYLWNKIDVCTPDKVSKAITIMRVLGMRTFTLIDKGVHTAILRVEDGRIVGCIGASWGPPGLLTPGCVDYEVCYWYGWPKRKPIRAEVPLEAVDFWIEKLTRIFGEPIITCDDECPYGEFSAAVGASFWICDGIPTVGDDWEHYLRI